MSKNDIIDVEPLSQERAQSLRSWGWVSYILHLIVAVAAVVPGAQVSIVLLLVALVMDLVKKDDAEGSWQESHFKWRISSVLWAGVLYLVTAPLFVLFYLPGAIAWTIISVWFLYRIIKGMVRMNGNQAMNG
ncbi:MAG: hypothetical protein WBC18_13005 [Ottowia sp.]|uniref:DUF4870 family protein n=1 Tax=unclassified Ottowia TaxID=2645081 RepID=UPI003C2D2EAA